ncbi:hypothetical protein [Streptomyces sp. NPDC001307]|uniref:hypothetical protein n=1 Tax=Streptomyces sp. NPDC001307 TaxID=3364560 RepID=UPI0036BA10C2
MLYVGTLAEDRPEWTGVRAVPIHPGGYVGLACEDMSDERVVTAATAALAAAVHGPV